MVILAGLAAAAAASLNCSVTQINKTHGVCTNSSSGCKPGPDSAHSMFVDQGCGGFFNCDGYVTECVSHNHREYTVCPCGPLPPVLPTGTFYVDGNAGPGGDGSQGKPFKTIQDCVNVAAYTKPNTSTSTCSVKAGVYREEVEFASGVQIIGEGPGKTILEGTEPVAAKFSKYKDQIWVASLTDADPKEILQLFMNSDGVANGNEYLTEARWPNANLTTQLSANTLAKMGPGSIGRADSTTLTASVCDRNMPVDPAGGSHQLDGARIFYRVNSGEETFTGLVIHSDIGVNGSRVGFERATCDCSPSNWDKTGQYYLQGLLLLLDSPGEWFYDNAERKLYVWMPDGSEPSGKVHVKVTDYCLHTAGAVDGNFKISQLSFSACTLYAEGDNSQISDVELLYPTYAPWISFRMSGSDYMPPVTFLGGDNNTVTRTYMRYTNNWGWYITGSNLLFEDNFIGDTNWYGSLDFVALKIGFSTHNPCTGGWQPPLRGTKMGGRSEELIPANTPSLKVPQGSGNVIRRTTIRGTGNDAIATSQLSNEVSLCHLSFAGLIGGDSAALHADNTHVDCGKRDCQKNWHHNWVHNSREKCVRCDDNSRNCTIYDNVIFNCGMPAANGAPAGILIKGRQHQVAHNTVFNATGQGGFAPETKGGTQNSDLNMWDNDFCSTKLRGPPEIFAYNVSNVNNATLWQHCLVDAGGYEFQPKASCAELVGKAVQHLGFDAGNSDIGAYAHHGGALGSARYGDEYNTTDWRPGCTFHPDCFARDDTWAEWPPPPLGGH